MVVSADELAYWRAAAGLPPRLAGSQTGVSGGAGVRGGEGAVLLSGASARQWGGWLNSSIDLEVRET